LNAHARDGTPTGTVPDNTHILKISGSVAQGKIHRKMQLLAVHNGPEFRMSAVQDPGSWFFLASKNSKE
jgi:hypothetical protein